MHPYAGGASINHVTPLPRQRGVAHQALVVIQQVPSFRLDTVFAESAEHLTQV